jgi:putative membrane protein
MLALFSGNDWTAAGHAVDVADRIVFWLGLAAAAILFVLVVRALFRRRLYRGAQLLSADEARSVREEIAAAERRTRGEIVAVVLDESDAHPQATWLAALTFVLAAAVLLAGDASVHPALLLPALLASGGLGYGLARTLPDFRRCFAGGARGEEMAEEQALQEFAGLGVHRTEGRTGILILVSLFERTVVVLGDDGIHARVGEEAWLETDRRILDGLRAGSLAAGLRAGIQSAGAVLAEHFPRAEVNPNELPDHLIVRRR